MLKGEEHISPDGRVTFDEQEVTTCYNGNAHDTFYRTVIGPSFANDGIVLADTNLNQSKALGRLLSCRYTTRKDMITVEAILAKASGRNSEVTELERLWDEVDQADDRTAAFARILGDKAIDMEAEMRFLQEQFMYTPDKVRYLQGILGDSKPAYLDAYVNAILYAQEHVTDPHPKKRLRMRAWEELTSILGVEALHVMDRLWLTEVLYKMKKDEVAKVGKWARMIGDLGVGASLQGFGCTDILKKMLCAPVDGKLYHEYKGFRIYVAKNPTLLLMTEIFEELINPTAVGTFAIFSDDACCAMRVDEKIVYGNLDISGCDSSHGPRAFYGMVEVVPEELKEDFLVCVDQCRLKIRIMDKGTKKSKKRVYMKQKWGEPVLYSGSTLTTVINGCANFNIAMQVIDDYHRGLVTDKNGIQVSAMRVGYYVTYTEANHPSELQFLKHSPMMNDEGEWVPMLNIGVLFRSSGTWKGDVPGRKVNSPSVRGFTAQRLLLQGMYPAIKTPLVQAMKEQVAAYTGSFIPQDYIDKHLPYNRDDCTQMPRSRKREGARSMVIPNSSLAARYGIPEVYLHELIEYISKTTPDHQYATPFVGRVLEVDYGLGCALSDGTTIK